MVGIFRHICLFCVAVFLAACSNISPHTFSPHTLGISAAEWQQLDSAKQREMQRNYASIARAQKSFVDYNDDPKSSLQVRITKGKVIFPPFIAWQAYRPVEFIIPEGACQNVLIQSQDATKNIKLRACYKEDVLYLDPSRYDVSRKHGSLRFHYLPLWEKSFTYRTISSSGYVQFRNVDITVKELWKS